MDKSGIQRALLSLAIFVAAMEPASSQTADKTNLTRIECLDLGMADNEAELSEILGQGKTADALRTDLDPGLVVQMACVELLGRQNSTLLSCLQKKVRCEKPYEQLREKYCGCSNAYAPGEVAKHENQMVWPAGPTDDWTGLILSKKLTDTKPHEFAVELGGDTASFNSFRIVAEGNQVFVTELLATYESGRSERLIIDALIQVGFAAMTHSIGQPIKSIKVKLFRRGDKSDQPAKVTVWGTRAEVYNTSTQKSLYNPWPDE